MPTIDPYAGTPEEFTESMWKEFVAGHRPSGENLFSKKSGEAALTGFVPSACLKAAMRFMLGYEQVTNNSPFMLMRKNPIRHPYYEQLWCNGVAEIEFKPDATSRAAIKKMTAAVRTFTPAALQHRAGYRYAKLVVRFAPTPGLKYREDSDPDYPNLSADRLEYRRNVTIDMEPRTETFESKLVYKFAEGEGCPDPYTNPKGKEVIAEQAQILIKPDVVLRWYDVPEAWLLQTGTHKPKWVLHGLGAVNSGSFLGFEEGTLLLVGAKMTRYPWALKPNVIPALPGAGLESEFLYDVEFYMSYFDPFKGYSGASPAVIVLNRGHNNFPYRGNVVAVPADPNSGRWFYASLNGDIFGQPLYQYVDFGRLFECAQFIPP